jgi:hypothetical protein
MVLSHLFQRFWQNYRRLGEDQKVKGESWKKEYEY